MNENTIAHAACINILVQFGFGPWPFKWKNFYWLVHIYCFMELRIFFLDYPFSCILSRIYF